MKNIFKTPITKGKDKVIDGVCSGIAQLIDVDPIWIRLLFLILGLFTQFSGYMLVIYICLVFIMREYKEDKSILEKK